jgi:peptidoglycan DL-endopeptidase CwlO
VLPMLRRKSKSTAVELPIEASAPVVVVVRPAVKKRPTTQRVLGLFTFLMVPGFLLASSIPAIAAGTNPFGDDISAQLAAPKVSDEGQTVAVTATAATEITRGTRQAASARAGAYSTVKPQQAGDDYPWRASGGGLSPLGYVTRQCTDFVAWRINRDHGTTSPFAYVWANMTPNGGSASRWAKAWNANGWQTSNTPVPGAVAWFNGNHIAYVKDVNSDGTVNLEEYNWGGDASYHTRTISASEVALFLYPPP